MTELEGISFVQDVCTFNPISPSRSQWANVSQLEMVRDAAPSTRRLVDVGPRNKFILRNSLNERYDVGILSGISKYLCFLFDEF